MANLLTSLTSAADSMAAYEQELNVVSNNTTNATTPGYVNQTLELDALPFSIEGNQVGGVAVGQLLSSRDLYAEQNVQSQQSNYNYQNTLNESLSSLNTTFSLQSNTSVSTTFNAFFAAWSQLSVTPNDSQLQQSVISAAQSVGSAFQATYSGLTGATTDLSTNALNVVNNINQLVGQIQQLNVQQLQSGGTGPDPGTDAELYANLESLSQYVNFTTLQNPDGTINIYLDGQQGLLVGTAQQTLSVGSTPSQMTVTDANGQDVTSEITGGELGAYLQSYNNVIPGYETQLNQLAQGFADAINTQQAAGVDSTNTAGVPLFSYQAAAPAATLAVASGFATTQIAAASAGNPGGNDNAIAMSQLQSATQPALGNFTFTEFYGNLATAVGTDISNSQNEAATGQQLLSQAQNIRANSSAVSLDQEATLLVQFQQSYDATSKLITILDELAQTVIDMIPASA
jgi:flagellar hook-associated protein 1